jgi:hypothetical protein
MLLNQPLFYILITAFIAFLAPAEVYNLSSLIPEDLGAPPDLIDRKRRNIFYF